MKARQWLNTHPGAALGIGLAMVLVALGVLWFATRPPADPGARPVYYMDMDTGEVFDAPRGSVPFTEAPSGGHGARAYVFSCGACNADEWFGYLESYSDEVRAQHKPGDPLDDMSDDHLIRPMEGGDWRPFFSRTGNRLRENMQGRCPDTLQECQPQP